MIIVEFKAKLIETFVGRKIGIGGPVARYRLSMSPRGAVAETIVPIALYSRSLNKLDSDVLDVMFLFVPLVLAMWIKIVSHCAMNPARRGKW